MCGVPGMVQLLGTQLGEADKVLAFMGLPSWRWCQVVASASEDQNRRKVGEVRLLYGGWRGSSFWRGDAWTISVVCHLGPCLSRWRDWRAPGWEQAWCLRDSSGARRLEWSWQASEQGDEVWSPARPWSGVWILFELWWGKHILVPLTFSCKGQERKRMWAQVQTRWHGEYTETLTEEGQESLGLWKGAGEIPGCCLLFKVWLLELGVFPGYKILFPEAPSASPKS